MISKENYIKLKALATVWNKLDKYVWLREDDKGRYIEYAFIKGAPHDNRCLSWYDKPHPNYFKNHPDLSQGRIKTVNELYKLREFCCGLSDKQGVEHCSAGHPKEDCDYITAGKRAGERWREWSYDEPIKCACWNLENIKESDLEDSVIPANKAQEYLNVLNKEK